MTYVRLDDHFPQHRKLLALDDAAFALHVRAICYSSTQLSDGEIPSNALSLLTRNRRPQGLIAQLVEADLWQSTLTGWRIHDYLDWQESSEAVWSKRAAARQRMQRLRSQDVRTNNSRSSPEVRELEVETEIETTTETEEPKAKPVQPHLSDSGTAPSPSEWPGHLQSVRLVLDEGRAPPMFYDVGFWERIDVAYAKHPDVFYVDELKNYLLWWWGQPPSRRRKVVTRSFTTWLRTEEAKSNRRRESSNGHHAQSGR
jgi:hypothetical protein